MLSAASTNASNSSPRVQSWRSRNCSLMICSSAWAWISTPGTLKPSAVLRMSNRPVAEVPIRMIRPSILGANSVSRSLSKMSAALM